MLSALWLLAVAADVPTAAPADSLGGVKVGAPMSAYKWKATLNGTKYLSTNVAGINGVVVPSECGGVIQEVAFMVQYTNAPNHEAMMVYASDPKSAATRSTEKMRDALMAKGYTRSDDDIKKSQPDWFVPLYGIGLYSRSESGHLQFRSVTIACDPPGDIVVACSAALTAGLAAPCTTGL